MGRFATWEARIGSSGGLPGVALFLLVGLGYAAGSLTSYAWFNAGGIGATFFPAAGVTLAALVLTTPRRWPICLAAVVGAEMTIDLAHGLTLGGSAGYAFANASEGALGATLVRRFSSQRPPNLSLGRDLFAFLGAVVIAPILGGVLGATNYAVVEDGSGWFDFMLEWLIGDGLGMLVIGSTILVVFSIWRRGDPGQLTSPAAVALVVAMIGLTGAVFWLHALPLAFLATAVLGWIALSVGTPGVALAGCGASLLAAQATANGHGFFEDLEVSPETGLVYLQLLLAFLVAGALALAAEVYERDRNLEAWVRSESALDRIELLRRVADRMAGAATRAQVATAVAEETIGPLGAGTAVLVVADADGQPVIVAAGKPPADYEASVREAIAADRDFPIVAAFRDGEVQMFGSRAEGVRRFPALAGRASEYQAALAVPLSAEGETIGAVSWGFTGEREFDPTIVSLAQAIASQCALALQRARLSEVDPRFARQTQRMMLPLAGGLPPGVELATRYLPTETRIDVGGDWYDITPCNSSHLAVAIGDLIGHGARPATAMGQLRVAASSLARDAEGPAQVLAGLDRFATSVPSAEFSTALCALYDYDSGELRYAAAGHPPPLLVADGEARVLGEARSGPICVPDDGHRPEAGVTLPKGAIVAFYTDGLVEQRGAVIDAGIERLGEALLACANSDLERTADDVLAAVNAGRVVADDVALVLLRVG